MQPAPLAPLALALASPALRLAIAAATLFATWAVARFLAVGIAHHRRQAEHDQAPPAEAEIEAWRRAVRRQLHTRWVGPLSPWAALAAAPVAPLVGRREAAGEEPGLHLVVGDPGTGTSAALWGVLNDLLADPDGGPTPLLVGATQLARLPGAGRPAAGSPSRPLDRLVAAELVDLTGMPAAVAERLAGEVVLLVDGFDELLASSPAAASGVLAALGARPDGAPGLLHHEPSRRIVVSTTPAGYEAFVAAGLVVADGPLATVTHLEPADGAIVRAAVAGSNPPCPALAAALDRLPGLAPLLGHPLWLDVALEAFAAAPADDGDGPAPGDAALAHLPATAGPREIAAALWDQWLERRLPSRPGARHLAAALARRHPPRRQPTFHLHDLGRSRPGAHAWLEGMAVGISATFLAASLPASIGWGRHLATFGVPVAIGAGALFAWVLHRHEQHTGRLGPSHQGEGAEDGDGPALAGVATGLMVMILVAGPLLAIDHSAVLVLMLWPLLAAVPVAVAAWLAFRARLGHGGQGPALLTLGAFGGGLGAMVFMAAAAYSIGDGSYPLPGDPADLMGWWTAALIVGPLVGLVDGMGLPDPALSRPHPGRAGVGLARSAPSMVGLPVIGSVLISGALLLGVLVQPTLAPWLAPFAAGGAVVGLAAWLVAASAADFRPDPARAPSTGSGATATAELRQVMLRALLSVTMTAVIAVPAAWLAGRWLSGQRLGPPDSSGFLRQQVPMVRPVLTGVAVAVGLWLLATLAAAGPLRQWAVQTAAAARGRVPRDYPAFLDELVAAGVLHRSGAGYRFRHPSLADHLTGQASASAPGRPHDAFDRAPPPVAV